MFMFIFFFLLNSMLSLFYSPLFSTTISFCLNPVALPSSFYRFVFPSLYSSSSSFSPSSCVSYFCYFLFLLFLFLSLLFFFFFFSFFIFFFFYFFFFFSLLFTSSISTSISSSLLRAGAMDNIKANVPRTAYRGIVTIWKDGTKLHIVPEDLT